MICIFDIVFFFFTLHTFVYAVALSSELCDKEERLLRSVRLLQKTGRKSAKAARKLRESSNSSFHPSVLFLRDSCPAMPNHGLNCRNSTAPPLYHPSSRRFCLTVHSPKIAARLQHVQCPRLPPSLCICKPTQKTKQSNT